ncbi:unnamed protein product [Lymnaea stagnalis]|uniref:Uncharacterized protein n=1 Tax=Lymnaea stagnalis TaxID=6523 RepID=A0AAV2H0Y1_LYMST
MPQNAIKRRSQSHNIVMSGALTPEPAKGHRDQDTTLEFEPSPLSPSATSSDSSFMQTPDNSKMLADAELETEVQLRPRSFRNAVRAHPITSVELNELLSRMRGSGLSRTSEDSTKQPDLPAARPLEQIESTLRNIDDSSEEDIADNVSVSNDKKKAALTLDLGQGHDSRPDDHKHNSTDSLIPSEIQFSKAERDKLIMTDARSTSMPDLNIEEVRGIAELKGTEEGKPGLYSQSVTNVNKDEYVQKGKGRLSRKDFHNSHIVKRRMKGYQDNEPGNTNVTRPVTAFHDSYSKRAAEKASLRMKGVQPANKEKHLSTPESRSHHQNSNAKLTVWNSVEKLTKGSMNDLSHLNEDPWVMNPEVASSTSRSDSDTHVSNSSHLPKPTASLGVTSRPRGHSDITEMMQVSLNKENFDWLVYLNRNSFPPKSDQTSLAMKRLSSLGIDQPAASQDSFSSQFHYATPPRSYMNSGNMNRHESGYKESSFSKAKPGVNALGGSTLPVSLTKPIQFHAHGLMRSNSSPMAGADKTVHKDRPTSLHADNLTDESDQMLAEMEAYISNSSDSIKSTNKFPTSLPAITVEDEDANNNNINRLSIASSLSTSSYDSQDSNSHSSDGLVGTLRHKLHTWAKRSTRHDSEQSHTSTLTSDDEDTETPKPTSNTFDPPLRNRNSWRDDRDLENVLREHGLGSTSLGSRMAFSMPTNGGNPSQPHNCSDIEIEDPVSPGGCGLSDTETPKFDSSSQNETNFSLPPAKEGEAALLRPAADLLHPAADLLHPARSQQDDVPAASSDSSESVQWDIPYAASSAGGQCESLSHVTPLKLSAQSHYGQGESNFISDSVQRESQTPDSGISFRNTDTPSDHPLLSDTITPAEPSPKEIPQTVNSNSDTNHSEEDRVNLRKRGSFESIDSVDSFYERRLSVAFDSDVFQDNPTIVGVYEDTQEGNVETATPRKTIREYIQQIEQKLRPPSPKIFEVKRREPGAMIRQRLETLRENVLYGRRSSSRQGSEEREGTRAKSQPPAQFRNKLTRATKLENRHSEDLRHLDRAMAASRDSLSKSMENLSKPRDVLSFSRESLLLSKSRDSLNSDSPTYQCSLSPLMNQNCGTPGHESDANRFTYINVEHKGNQFLHRARSNSDQPESDTAMAIEGGTLSRSMCRLDQVNAEVDNLVIMKGWVRALISKFQQKD